MGTPARARSVPAIDGSGDALKLDYGGLGCSRYA